MAHKILVIDDSMVIRRTVKDMLPAGKFEVIEAKDGMQGYELICSQNPNLIILDFILPKMNGWDVYRKLQDDPNRKSIPLLIISGRKNEVTEKIPEPFEYFAFVEKPFDQKQLLTGIKEAMEKAKKHEKVALPGRATDTGSAASEIQLLNAKIAKMQGEIDVLKKQLNQLVIFIKQKLS
jgi:two-component system response regulator